MAEEGKNSMLLQQYQFQLFADYFQFYVEDEGPKDTTEHIWEDKRTVEIGLALEKSLIAVSTERNFTVPFTLEIHDSEPDDDFSDWDRVNECSIEVPSGILVIFGCTDYRPDAVRVTISPQCYRARIYSGGLDTVMEFDKGNDHYKMALWAAPFSELKILKERIKKT
jgi:hypothetical protein